jgi:hypothetical protein
MSSEPNNEVLLERLRAIPAVARNILQTQDDDDESDSEETSDGIDSNPSVDDGMPNDRIELDPRQVSPFASRLARLARPDSEHRSSSDDINEVD